MVILNKLVVVVVVKVLQAFLLIRFLCHFAVSRGRCQHFYSILKRIEIKD